MNSLEDVPGYFNQTLTAVDYLSSELPSAHSNKPEMAYNGPPSHLQNSEDVHPFWFEYGREYYPKERFMDRSLDQLPGSIPPQLPGAIPPSLIPGTETAQEMRDIEIRETMASLRQQVEEVWTSKIDEEEEETMDDTTITSSLTTALSSSEPDGNMTQEEKSTLEFFESMLSESQDFDDIIDGGDDIDGSGASHNMSPVSEEISLDSTFEENSQPWNTHEPRLTSLLPNDLGRPLAGHVHSVVSEGHRSLEGSPHRTVLSHANSFNSLQSNGHAGFLQNNMYLPKESSISSLHRKAKPTTTMSPTRRAPPPPTKPKPKRGSANKRNSYPMTASEPTELGPNFLLANKHQHGIHPISSGNHQNGGLHSNGVTSSDEKSGVKNIVSRFNLQQPRHSNSFNEPNRPREKSTHDPGFRHSMYADNNNIPSSYGHYYHNNGYNGNVNNSNEDLLSLGDYSSRQRLSSDGALSNEIHGEAGPLPTKSAASGGVILKDTETGEDMVLHGIRSDLLQLQLS